MKPKLLLDREVHRHRHGDHEHVVRVQVEASPQRDAKPDSGSSVGWSPAYDDGWEATFGGGKGRAN